MRTTLDLDPRVLAAARARVSHGHNRSLGEAVSDLALAGLAPESRDATTRGGIVLLPSRPGRIVTDEMVVEALLDD
jgi:hypothetical protein